MTDDQFLTRLESCTLSPSSFNHKGHVRAAFLILCAEPSFGLALDRMSRAIRAYASAQNADGLYHETITVAFMAIVNARMHQSGQLNDWMEFVASNPDLLASGSVLTHHYNAEILKSDLARSTFLLPGWVLPEATADKKATHLSA